MNRTPDISDQTAGSRHFGRLLFLPVILPLLLTSCEKTIDWPLDTNEPKVIVVEGVITNERTAHEVKISRPMADINGTPQPVSGALVSILESGNGSNDSAIRLREDQPGRYLTDSTVRADSERRYKLKIFYQGREYYSEDSRMVSVEQLEDLSYSPIPDHEFWYEMNFKKTNRPTMVDYRLNWGHLPGFRDLPIEQTRAHFIYYTVVNYVDVNEIFQPGKERVPFPVGTRVYRRQYSMNREQEDFVRSLMAETEWRGGLFDVQPGNVRSNMSHGAMGYFSVSEVVADFTIIRPKD